MEGFGSYEDKNMIQWNSISVNLIREGFRIVPLFDKQFNLNNDSFLFVQVKLSHDKDQVALTIKEADHLKVKSVSFI
jgi:hypothetical protein